MLQGVELKQYSFFAFVVDTYEEQIPCKEVPDIGLKEQTSDQFSHLHQGHVPNQRSHYLPKHPKHLTHHWIVQTSGHNTLPNIVGPFFPNPNDESMGMLYCTSMLTLLQPWRQLQNIKEESETFHKAYQNLYSTATQVQLDILSGVQYYYDCKSAAREQQGEEESVLDENAPN